MSRNPHFYLNSFLRGLVTATTDEALTETTKAKPYEVVDRLSEELEELTRILSDIADHLYEDDPPQDEYDPQQELNYYAGLEL